jgi:putative transposase
VLTGITARQTNLARRAMGRAIRAVREASRPAVPVLGLAADLLRPRKVLLAENILLRQQLIVLRRQTKRARLTAVDRLVMIAASAATGSWSDSMLIVKPETILRWHREVFQNFWR